MLLPKLVIEYLVEQQSQSENVIAAINRPQSDNLIDRLAAAAAPFRLFPPLRHYRSAVLQRLISAVTV